METKKTNQMMSSNQYEVWAIRPKNFNGTMFFVEPESPKPYTQDSDLIIPIHGVLEQKDRGWGNTNYENIAKEISNGLSNASITQIILDIDSPGGSVLGIDSLAETIFKSRFIKPIIARINSMAASAAYWIASACSKIVLTSETTVTGSIGVVALHCDYTKQEDMFGIKITEIVAGKYKRVVSSHASLDNAGKQFLQSQVDTFYQIFLQAVAKYRDLDINKVLSVADGKEYIGSQAINAGLADQILTEMKGINNMPTMEELQEEIEKLKKENEELKNKKDNAQSQDDEEEKKAQSPDDEEEKKQADRQQISIAISQERQRMLAIDEIDKDPSFHDIAMQAKQEGWNVEKTAYHILKAQTKRPGSKNQANIVNSMAFESQLIPGTMGNTDESEIMTMAQRIANPKGGK